MEFGTLGSVVLALRLNTTSTLLGVKNGFSLYLDLNGAYVHGHPYLLNQNAPFRVLDDRDGPEVVFLCLHDVSDQMCIAVLAAMRTNETVSDLTLYVGHVGPDVLRAVGNLLLENAALTSFHLLSEEVFSWRSRDMFLMHMFLRRAMMRNMSMQQLDIKHLDLASEADAQDPVIHVDLGADITAALTRNHEAFAVAQAIGQVSRTPTFYYPHLEGMDSCLHLLAYFLPQGCHPTPLMRYVAQGLQSAKDLASKPGFQTFDVVKQHDAEQKT